MEKWYKYIVPYLSRDLIDQKIYLLRDSAFGADCLTPFRILKIIIVGLKNRLWLCYQELLHVVKFQILIPSPL